MALVPDGALHFHEEGLDLLAVLLSIGSLKDEREGYEEVVCHASCRCHRWWLAPSREERVGSCHHDTTQLDWPLPHCRAVIASWLATYSSKWRRRRRQARILNSRHFERPFHQTPWGRTSAGCSRRRSWRDSWRKGMERGTYTGPGWASSRALPPSLLPQAVRLVACLGQWLTAAGELRSAATAAGTRGATLEEPVLYWGIIAPVGHQCQRSILTRTLLTKLSTIGCGLCGLWITTRSWHSSSAPCPVSCMYFCVYLLQFICTANICSVSVRDVFCVRFD